MKGKVSVSAETQLYFRYPKSTEADETCDVYTYLPTAAVSEQIRDIDKSDDLTGLKGVFKFFLTEFDQQKQAIADLVISNRHQQQINNDLLAANKELMSFSDSFIESFVKSSLSHQFIALLYQRVFHHLPNGFKYDDIGKDLQYILDQLDYVANPSDSRGKAMLKIEVKQLIKDGFSNELLTKIYSRKRTRNDVQHAYNDRKMTKRAYSAALACFDNSGELIVRQLQYLINAQNIDTQIMTKSEAKQIIIDWLKD